MDEEKLTHSLVRALFSPEMGILNAGPLHELPGIIGRAAERIGRAAERIGRAAERIAIAHERKGVYTEPDTIRAEKERAPTESPESWETAIEAIDPRVVVNSEATEGEWIVVCRNPEVAGRIARWFREDALDTGDEYAIVLECTAPVFRYSTEYPDGES